MSYTEPVARPISAGEILSHSFSLLRRGAPRVAIALVVLAAPGIAIDAGYAPAAGESTLTLLNSALTLALQFWLTKAALDDLGWRGSPRVRFPAFVMLGILTGVGILLGLVLLVVPGIILMVRWSLSVPILLGSNEGVVDSIGRSWRETEGRFWPILGALAAVYAPAILLAVAAVAFEQMLPSPLPSIVMMNVFLQAGVIVGWHVAVALYVLFGGPAALSRVFE